MVHPKKRGRNRSSLAGSGATLKGTMRSTKEDVSDHLPGRTTTDTQRRRAAGCNTGTVTLSIAVLAILVALSVFFLHLRRLRRPERLPRNDFDLIDRVMNRSISPCRNFHGYVCYNWARVQPGVESVFALTAQWIVHEAENIILNKMIAPFQTTVMDKVIAAVKNCHEVRTKKLDNMQRLTGFLAENGMKLPPSRGEDVPSPLELSVTLNLRLGIPAIFSLRPTVDLRTNDRMILTFMTDLFALDEFRRNVPSCNTRVAPLINGDEYASSVRDVNTKFLIWLLHGPSEANFYMTLRQLANSTPSISETEWLNAINQHLLSPISGDTFVFVFESVGIYLLDKFMGEYKDNPLPAANWITLFVYYLFAGASSYPLQNAFSSYGTTCFSYMRDLVPHAINAAMTQQFVSTDEVETARRILRTMRGRFSTLFSWNDAESRTKAVKRLNDTMVILGVPNKFYSPAVMEKEYRFLPSFKGPFVEDILRAHKERTSYELFIYAQGAVHEKTDREASIFSSYDQSEAALYVPYLHTVYIPTAILTAPFVLLGSLAATYGLLGSRLGHEFLHAFSPDSIDMDASGVKVKWMTNKTLIDYQARVNCIIDLYNQPGLSRNINYTKMTLDENYADIAGFELLLAALQSDPCVNLDAPSPIKGLSNKQLFYVAYCFKYCAVDKIAFGYSGGEYPVYYQRCNKVLSNFEDFWRTFQCNLPSRKRCLQL